MRPKKHRDKAHREQARRQRDWEWGFADRVARLGTIWVCWWDKDGRHGKSGKAPDDLLVCCLITGCELSEWLNRHPDWWDIGEWDDARYAAPVSLTEVGRAALANRSAYDMEPVTWGLCEPGHEAIPLPSKVSGGAP